MRIGIISDTHSGLPVAVLKTFEGVDLILHAGDIGSEDVLVELESVAPVKAVRGNCDLLSGRNYPLERRLELSGRIVLVRHIPPADFSDMDGVDVLVHGHTHVPRNEKIGKVLVFNPGYGGKTKGNGVTSIGFLEIDAEEIKAWIREL